MSDLIDKQAFRSQMYHEAFETDTSMQRWDAGCWIRYKLFENIIEAQPVVDAVRVIRCKDCKWQHGIRCDRLGAFITPDNYCSYAVRRNYDGN